MPIYPFKCPMCGVVEEILMTVKQYGMCEGKVACPNRCCIYMDRIFTPVNVICRWGTGFVGGERLGYIPGVDDPTTEIKADMKALEEKRMHEDNPVKKEDLTLALSRFTEAHEDILK